LNAGLTPKPFLAKPGPFWANPAIGAIARCLHRRQIFGSYTMLKRHNEFFKNLMLLNDLLLVSLAWWMAYFIRFHTFLFVPRQDYIFRHYVVAWLLVVAVWTIVFTGLDLYRPRRISSRLRELADLFKASCLALPVFLAVLFLIREIVLSRAVVVIFWSLSLLLLSVSHVAVRETLRLVRRRGYNLRRALIIGAPVQGKQLLDKLVWYRHLGLSVSAIFFTDEWTLGPEPTDARVLRTRGEVQRLVHEQAVDIVFITLPLEQSSKLGEIQRWLGDDPVTVYYVPDFGEFSKLRGSVEEFDGLQIISLQSSPLDGWNALMKRAIDISLGGIALCVFAPVMALIAVAIKLTSAGPVLYRQERMGLDRKRFDMLKFRTMVPDAERRTGPIWAADNDPRITPLGRWLRRTSLDELPQLINVLRGEMSLVGPRPERPPLIEEFRKSMPKYMLRHKVKAGMTGWAQVNGWRGNTDLETRIAHDLDYIQNWSLWRDVKILSATLFGGFLHKNAS
jgi:Undecaprenyl-phosphate glucose phosphotransferase